MDDDAANSFVNLLQLQFLLFFGRIADKKFERKLVFTLEVTQPPLQQPQPHQPQPQVGIPQIKMNCLIVPNTGYFFTFKHILLSV